MKLMTEQEIYKKIDTTYNSEKGKNFITHLLRSFFPVNRAQFVMFAPTDEQGNVKKMVCCITGVELKTKSHQLEFALKHHDTLFKAFTKKMIRGLNKEEQPTEVELKADELKKEAQTILLAIGCEKSDKYLSVAAFQQLQNFYFSELLRDNKHINWIANNERGKEFVKQGKKEGIITTKKEEKVTMKVVEHAKMSLGDLSVLQNLKKRMENK